MLSQSTRMPGPAASPPDARHPTQCQVCSVNQPGCQDLWQVPQTLCVQPRVRYAQSINPDANSGGRSSRRRASNPESGRLCQSTKMPRPVAGPPDAGHPTQSQLCSVNQPGCQDWASNPESGRLSLSTRMPRSAASPPDAGHPTQSQVGSVNQPGAKTCGRSSRRRASNPESVMLSQSTWMPRLGLQPRVR
jgi:hypothetical protein